MTHFKHEERLSRQQAAERLADLAFALTAGGTLELRAEGEQLRVPVAGEVVLKRESKSNGARVEVELRLSWSARADSRPCSLTDHYDGDRTTPPSRASSARSTRPRSSP